MSDTSGSLSTSGYNGRYLTFSWSLSGQDVGGNTSTINWSLYGDGPEYVADGVAWYKCRNVELKIDGSVVYSSGQDNPVELRSGTTVASGSFTLSHQSDGTKAFGVNIQAAIYNWAVNCSGYTEWRLPDIARASQPSIRTYPNNSPDFNLGDTITVHMNRASSAFTHNVYFYWDDRYVEVAKNVTDNCTFNTNAACISYSGNGENPENLTSIKQNFLKWNPNATSKSGYIYVSTFNGSALIGHMTCPYVAHFVNVAPKINSVTITDDNANAPYPGGKLSAIEGGKFIQGYSRVRFKISAGSDYWASIARIDVSLSGQYKSGSDVSYSQLGDGKWTVTATDSRGFTVSKSGSFPVIQYAGVTISTAKVTRDESDTSKAWISLSGTWTNGNLGNGNNAISISVSGGESKALSASPSGNRFTVNRTALSGTYEPNSTYSFIVTVKDKLQTVQRNLTLYEILPVVAYFKNRFDIYGDLHIHDRNNESRYGIITERASEIIQTSRVYYCADCTAKNGEVKIDLPDIATPQAYNWFVQPYASSNDNYYPVVVTVMNDNSSLKIWLAGINPTDQKFNWYAGNVSLSIIGVQSYSGQAYPEGGAGTELNPVDIMHFRKTWVNNGQFIENASSGETIVFKVQANHLYSFAVNTGDRNTVGFYGSKPKSGDTASYWFCDYMYGKGQQFVSPINGYCAIYYSSTNIGDIRGNVSVYYESAEHVPGYYITHLDAKENTIKSIESKIGSTREEFAWITDMHIEYNTNHAPALINHIMQHTGTDKIFFTGDAYNGVMPKDIAKKTIEMFKKMWPRKCLQNFYYVVGNHEWNDPGKDHPGLRLSESELASLCYWNDSVTKNGLTYYFDDSIKKVRHICMNCEYDCGVVSESEKAVSIINATPDGWTVILYSHPGTGEDSSTMHSIWDRMKTVANALSNNAHRLKVVGIFSGHIHADNLFKYNGINICSLTCDTWEQEYGGLTRQKGTITEQAFDVVNIDLVNRHVYLTRIGAGADREFTY